MITKMYNVLKKNNPLKTWHYGHFHTDKLTERDGVKFELLGIGTFKEIRE